MTIKWDTAYDTGLRQIDLQHRELVNLINDTDTAMREGASAATTEAILQQLRAYVLFHFATEERLLTQATVDPSHAEAHRQAHAAFTAYVDRAFQLWSQQDLHLADIVQFLENWLIGHIQGTDKDLARLLQA